MFGKRDGFLKFKADVIDKEIGNKVSRVSCSCNKTILTNATDLTQLYYLPIYLFLYLLFLWGKYRKYLSYHIMWNL